jgi:signal transduction histidine kinase/integral membrane sensor domain MASE1/ActR/RegA family two-component response regulator
MPPALDDTAGAPSGRQRASRVRDAAIGAGLAIAYYAAAQAGFSLAFVAEQVTTVWAPTGIALGALLLGGLRFWPAIWVGAFLANAVTAAPLWTAVLIATGNTLEGVAAVLVLGRIRPFSSALERTRDVLSFIGVAALGCTTLSATVGVLTLCAAGVQPWDRFLTLWTEWWFGDVLGAVLVAPAILAAWRHEWSRDDVFRGAMFVAGSLIVSHLVFGQVLGFRAHPLEYAIFPVVIGAAATTGLAITSVVALSASAVAIWHTMHGVGPFAAQGAHDGLILLQAFMVVLAATALLLAAATTERRAIERRDRSAATMLRMAQRAGGVATFEWDFRRQVAHCSAEFFEIFAMPPRDDVVMSAEWSRFVHPEDRESMGAHLARALAGSEPAAADYRIVRPDGSIRWLTYAGQVQRTTAGDRMLGTVVDITDRKRLEADLRHHVAEVDRILASMEQAKAAAEDGQHRLSEANRELARRVREQETLLDVLPIGIGIANDPACRHIRVNRAFAKALGIGLDANASLTAAEDDRPRNFRVLTPQGAEVSVDDLPMQVAARDGREVRDLELDVVHDDGRTMRLLEYAAPLLDEQGRPRGAIGAFVDVTAAHLAREELTRSEMLLRQEVEVRTTLAEVGASLAGELRSEKLIQAVTDASTRLTDAELGTFIYNASGEHEDPSPHDSPSGDSTEASQLFGPAFRGDTIIRIDDATVERHARSLPFDATPGGQPVRSYLAVPVVGRGGVVLGGLFFGHSKAGVFTKRHELLAAGVAGWAAIALDNAWLYQEAAEANRLKDEFLATLSHELRTPLNAVLGWAHMLREGSMQPSMHQRALESVERNARAQAQLVEDLLDVSRIMAGKLQVRTDAVDLAAVVTHAVETVRAGVTAKRLNLHLRLPSDERVIVTGDADRLQQVVWNLVSNAIKFTPAGGRVDVELRRIDSTAEISVRDTGQGIDPAFRPHLFQRFRQMDASKTRQYGGLGLGLSIVRHLVEAHGGTVAAESDGLNRGATFRVFVPLRAIDRSPADAAVDGNMQTALALAGLRALIVDDEMDARDLTRYVLESRGAGVVVTKSAGEALRRLASDPFDVLVADIGMPGQDGLSLIRAIRSLPERALNRDIPAVALTAYISARERDETLAAGFDSHLGKPADPEQLIVAISRVVRRADPRG